MTGVALTIDGRRHAGWTRASVQRSIEQIAGAFQVTVSERAPGEATPRVVRPGDRCAVELDGERVLAGHVDAVRVRYDADAHDIEVTGRERTADLVDCSAPSAPGEWRDADLETIVAALCAPFGVGVRAEAAAAGPFRRFRIEEGETVYEAIERGCRLRGVLALADGVGGLVLGPPVRDRAATELRRGVNVLAGSGFADRTDRYAEYTVLGQQPGDAFVNAEAAAHVLAATRDPGVARHRPLKLLAEQALTQDEALRRAEWEASVRAARSRRAGLVVQGWRERGDAGALWAPGRLVRVVDDWLGLDRDLLVTGVRQTYDAGGALTRLSLAPRGAFSPRPEPESGETTGLW